MSGIAEIAEKATFSAAKLANAFALQPCHYKLKHYHEPDACLKKPARPLEGHPTRGAIYETLKATGLGASLVPDTETVTCPFGDVKSLEAPASMMGFDTTWVVENTSLKSVVLARVVNGVEISPFHSDLSPMDDPKAQLLPGDWTSIPTFESYVYHVREIDENGNPGDLVLQHRAGMIPLGNAGDNLCGTPNEVIDPEPFVPETTGPDGNPVQQKQEGGRGELGVNRKCNTIDVGFRNKVGCPLTVSYSGGSKEVPDQGFMCDEHYSFHMGTNDAPQDFFHDWSSRSKYEGALLGQTFVARLAKDPSVVVDKYTLEPTRIVDCRIKEKEATVTAPIDEAELAGVQNQNGLNTGDEHLLDSLAEVEERLAASAIGGVSRSAAVLSGTSN